MSRINTNVASQIAQRVLGQNNHALSLSLERLSTGVQGTARLPPLNQHASVELHVFSDGVALREIPPGAIVHSVFEPADNVAIHGLVRWATWTVGRRLPHAVVMEHLLHPRPGYPFSLALRIEYALSTEGLSVTTTATNVGPDPCPYGCGAHPYLRLGTARIDALAVIHPLSALG